MASLPSVSQVGTLSPFRPSRCPDDANSAHPGPSTASPTCSPCAILWSFFSTSPVSRMSGAHVHCSTSHIPIAGTPDRGPPHGHCNSSGHCSLQHMCRLHPPLPSPVGAPPATSAGRPPLPPLLFVLVPVVAAPLSCPLCSTGYYDIQSPLSLPPPFELCPPNPPSQHSFCAVRRLFKFLAVQLVALCSVHCSCRRWPPSHPSIPYAASLPVFRLDGAHSTLLSSRFLQSPLHQPSLCGPRPSFPVGKRPGGRLADGRRHREPLFCRSLFWFWCSSIVVVSEGAMGLCTTGSWASAVVRTSLISDFFVSWKHSLP